MWKKLLFNRQNIKASTPSAYLIMMPRGSRYPDYLFWYPAKLIKEAAGKGYFMSLTYADNFQFRLIKYGHGRFNQHKIIHQLIVPATVIEEAFGASDKSIDQAIVAHNAKPKGPRKLMLPGEAEIDEDLRDEN